MFKGSRHAKHRSSHSACVHSRTDNVQHQAPSIHLNTHLRPDRKARLIQPTAEIDSSGGTRGKLYRSGATLNLPVYLEAEVQTRLAKLANDKGIDFPTLVNEMLRKDIEIIEMAK